MDIDSLKQAAELEVATILQRFLRIKVAVYLLNAGVFAGLLRSLGKGSKKLTAQTRNMQKYIKSRQTWLKCRF